jgi:hypothetical protein
MFRNKTDDESQFLIAAVTTEMSVFYSDTVSEECAASIFGVDLHFGTLHFNRIYNFNRRARLYATGSCRFLIMNVKSQLFNKVQDVRKILKKKN